jgi:hypothetical protein
LKNIGTTFQREMDHAFKDLIGKFMADYQDDFTIHSRVSEKHTDLLKKVFERCRLYGIYLNPKKCLFAVSEGKLLGHIVSKEGIYIDLERVKAINELNPPTLKKGVQLFFGKKNFVRRLVQNYATIMKPINVLLKKDHKIELTQEIQREITKIKHAITSAPIFVSPNFDQYFIVYSVASKETIASIF